MARCYIFLVLIMLQLTSAYIIDEANPDGESAANGTEAKYEKDAGDESNTKDVQRLLGRLLKFIERRRLVRRCARRAFWKTRHILKQRKGNEKSALRGSYQILQHGEESTASDRRWLGALRSEICSGCVVKRICNRPPKFLRRNSLYRNRSDCRKLVLFLASHIPSGEQKLKCNPDERYRSIDGTCNNLENPKWGAALTAFERIEFPDYGDDLSEPRKSQSNKPLPNARDISRKVEITTATTTTTSSLP
ncbi:heme peroxidase [Desmophyllum pertusum]|uniref:Heme peroxidase n=1 Tax=Desmophyllum pertusum TaxID=174260 RepID=A0A9W9YCP8_9CNID|nr:heme peroxidase [Desmophyllum pertusum]